MSLKFDCVLLLDRGQRPRHLLAGEALQDDEPSKPVAAPEGSAAAAKALKKLKKEQK